MRLDITTGTRSRGERPDTYDEAAPVEGALSLTISCHLREVERIHNVLIDALRVVDDTRWDEVRDVTIRIPRICDPSEEAP